MIEQPLVLTGPISHHLVVTAHDGGGLPYADAEFEGQQIALASGLFRQAGIDNRAAGLLIVQREVLDVAHDVVVLDAADDMAHRHTGKHRIFAGVLEQPAVSRVTRKIGAAADRLIVALRTEFTSDDVAV